MGMVRRAVDRGLRSLGQGLERGQRLTGDRSGEPSVDDPRKSRHGRLEDVLDRDPAAARARFDPPCDVHAAGDTGDVAKPQAAYRRLVPGPRAPGDRDPETEERGDASPGDELDDERGVVAAVPDRGPYVMGEQRRPPLDVLGEGEDDVGTGGHVDADLAMHPKVPARSWPGPRRSAWPARPMAGRVPPRPRPIGTCRST